MTTPCDGLRVVDFTGSYPGALATMVLADSGAEVIKVEPPGGDPSRRHYAAVMWHRGKKSVVLDLKSDEGRRDAQSLAAGADVVVESFRPGVAERLGIGYETLSRASPSLVYCSITGFGPRGPLAGFKAYEGVVHAKAGRMDAFYTLVEKDGPIYPALAVASYGAAMASLHGTLTALMLRDRTGEGQKVETSLLQGLTCFDLWNFLNWQIHERTGEEVARGYSGPAPPYMTGRSKDGQWFQFGNLTVDTLRNFMSVMGLEEAFSDPRFRNMPVFENPDDQQALQRLLLERIAEKTRDEWMEIFMARDVGAEPFRTTQEGLDHPQALHNGDVIDLVDPSVGPTKQLGPIARLTDTPLEIGRPAPSVGEHQDEIMASPSRRRNPAIVGNGRMPPHPLSGITVLEFASYIATPFATALLADLGARVIKIEPITGDLYRAGRFPRMGKMLQGKEGLALDLKDPRAQEAVHRLIEKTDVLIHNFRPGVPERLGIDHETVRRINPQVVYLYAGAYGSSGPHSARIGFHPIAGAITGGPRYQLGRAFPPPADRAMSLDEIDYVSDVMRHSNEPNPDPVAALANITGVLLALYARGRLGRGQYLETSMIGGNLYSNADDALWYEGKPKRMLPDAEFNGLHALYRLYPAASGWVFLACPEESEWRAFAGAVDRGDLLEDARFRDRESRLGHDGELSAELAGLFRRRPASEWEGLLTPHDVACVEVFQADTGKFFLATPWLKDAGFFVETEHPSTGPYWRYGPTVGLSKTPGVAGPVIYIGEHTREILSELGYDDDAIAQMEAAKVAVRTGPGEAEAG